MHTYDIGIVGGGITGLAAAYRLADRGHSVALLESAPTLGGLIGTFEQDGFAVENLYHHFFDSDTVAFDLIRELGLGDDLVLRQTLNGFYFDGVWHNVSRPINLLSFTPLSFPERIRLGLALLKAKKQKSIANLDSMSVAEWLKLKPGSRMQTVFDRLIRGKFGISANEVSAAFLCGRFLARARNRGITSATEHFGYLRGSLNRIGAALVERIQAHGALLRTDCRADAIGREGDVFTIRAGGETIRARAVISTIPPAVFGRIADFYDDAGRQRLGAIRYGGVICTVAGLDRSLSPYYWGTVCDPSLPFQLIVEQSLLLSPEDYGGQHVIYASRYIDVESLRALDPAEYEKQAMAALQRVALDGKQPKVFWSRTFAYPAATPIFAAGFQHVLAALPQVDGVFLTGMPFIYPNSRNVNSMLIVAEDTAARAHQWLGERKRS